MQINKKKTVIDHTHLYTNKQTTDRDMLLENIEYRRKKQHSNTHTHTDEKTNKQICRLNQVLITKVFDS